MRRVLVPLDGTDLAASILPDARRLAGPEGELILLHSVSRAEYEYDTERRRDLDGDEGLDAVARARDHLEAHAQTLRDQGVAVQTRTWVMGHAADAIDEAARLYRADAIACATHGRGPLGRLVHGSVAWQALAASRVPVLLRHYQAPPAGEIASVEPQQRRILIPLDGSALAEAALPLAQQLSREWSAALHLVRVASYPSTLAGMAHTAEAIVQEAQAYLHSTASRMAPGVQISVHTGPVVATLLQLAQEADITDIVMASHGRTGLRRAVFGSVADELIHKLVCPVVVVPALAARQKQTARAGAGAETHEPVSIS